MVRHRLAAAIGLATLLLLGRGAVAFASANANWNPAFNDPTRVDISDISGLVTKTVLHTDPMDDVRRALRVLSRHSARVAIPSPSANDQASPEAHRPRAPPADSRPFSTAGLHTLTT